MDAFAAERGLGPDARLDEEAFLGRLRGRWGGIKSALMNPSIVAGIGNVYADEILFQTGVHPAAQVRRPSAATLRHIYRAMRRILACEARKGGDGRRAPSGWLLGGRNAAAPCPRCGGALARAAVAGRTAWFCPRCQRNP